MINLRRAITLSSSLAVVALAVIAIARSTATAAAQTEGECDAADGSCDASSAPPGDGDDDRSRSRSRRRAARAKCEDKEPDCPGWARLGECENNPNYMLGHCPISCDSCPEATSFSDDEEELLDAVEKYGKPQRVEGVDAPKTLEVIRKTVAYMENDVYGPNPSVTLREEVLNECTNREELCAFWAAIGECEANKAYMKTKCAPSCQTCEMIDMKERCPPLGDDVRPGLLPGELNAMFERIVATAPGNQTDENFVIEDGLTNYTVHVHSRPKPLEEGEEVISRERDLDQPPWVITFENFLSEEECKHVIQLGYKSKYERSEDVGDVQPDGSYDSVRSTGRTSENAWCSYRGNCRDDMIVQSIHHRIEMVTGIPANHSEDLQLLKYEHGQYYRPHHDYIEHQRDRRSGPRILTFFLYLSDLEEGGATNFPKLDIAVKPKIGRALLWPSVLDSNPKDKEPMTDHEAQDVIKGTKFGANAWLHLHDYMAAQELGCT
eukprot:CAMPEP_0172554422 /NCGR_PEP_ID=MMETSP1067-20121228/54494_1 /TAXON_ID=265564 ORGANISM="Thalassiosira punctigera, Strain Tpunct2005C2" /NCGR_SAMPLE_ID=MMETSP1067 /ASSEMBLY_ACC=CAM_ASM_000444 /LENGTH=492 /DNA_ID=CAMNT_0013342791 /DNA_START=82 /DNA_END=1560 /DNA_ORIENTATION=-